MIPCRNHGHLLARAIDSALAQEEVCEVIVIEDGGTDGADAICREYEKRSPERFRWILHPPGQAAGVGMSRNEGIRCARSDWIAFLDADDRYLRGRFSEDARVLSADPTLDGVYDALGAEFIDRDAPPPVGETSLRVRPRYGIGPGLLTTLRGRFAPEELLEHLNPLGKDGAFTTDSILLHRRVFEKTGTLFGSRKTGEDSLLWLQIATAGRLAAASIDRPVAMRGLHQATCARIQRTSRQSALDVLGAFLDWARSAGYGERVGPLVDRARLRFSTHWDDVFRVFCNHPRLVLSPKTWHDLLYWALVRQFPDDPVLPGFFPSLRRKR